MLLLNGSRRPVMLFADNGPHGRRTGSPAEWSDQRHGASENPDGTTLSGGRRYFFLGVCHPKSHGRRTMSDFYRVAESSAGGIFGGEPRDERTLAEKLLPVVESQTDPRPLVDRVRTDAGRQALESQSAQETARLDNMVRVWVERVFSPRERQQIDQLPPEERDELMDEIRAIVAADKPAELSASDRLRERIRVRIDEMGRVPRSPKWGR